MRGEPVVILLVEDDPAHAEIVQRCLKDYLVGNRMMHVEDGQQALDYLYRREEFSDLEKFPRPHLILLDLRLPKVDGLEVLEIIKGDSSLCQIPVVILTTSGAEADMVKAYKNHANSYLVKPVDFTKFMAQMKALGYFWLIWNEYPF
jgi:DNA-binding response OmpR family regulator